MPLQKFVEQIIFTCDYNEDLTFLRTLVSQLPKQEKTTMLEIIDYCDKARVNVN